MISLSSAAILILGAEDEFPGIHYVGAISQRS